MVVGTDPEDWSRALMLAEAHDGIWVGVGIHPHQAEHATDSVLQELRETAKHPKVVALGETGLDFYRDWSPQAVQEAAFRQQIRLARTLGPPVVIHCRDAREPMLALLAEERAD